MSIFKQKENYIKQFCIQDVEVQHTVEVEGVARNSFFRLNDEEELLSATIQNISYPCVGIIGFSGKITDKDNALVDIRHAIKNGIGFFQHVQMITGDDGAGYTDEISDAYDQTFALMERYIKYMKDDFELNGHCGGMTDFDLNKISYVPAGPVLQNEYGWIMYYDDEQKATSII